MGYFWVGVIFLSIFSMEVNAGVCSQAHTRVYFETDVSVDQGNPEESLAFLEGRRLTWSYEYQRLEKTYARQCFIYSEFFNFSADPALKSIEEKLHSYLSETSIQSLQEIPNQYDFLQNKVDLFWRGAREVSALYQALYQDLMDEAQDHEFWLFNKKIESVNSAWFCCQALRVRIERTHALQRLTTPILELIQRQIDILNQKNYDRAFIQRSQKPL